MRIYLHHQLNDLFHMRGVEEVLHGIVVGWRGNHHKVSLPIRCHAIKGCLKVKLFLGKELFYVLIADRRFSAVDFVNLLLHHVNSQDMMMLTEQRGDA